MTLHSAVGDVPSPVKPGAVRRLADLVEKLTVEVRAAVARAEPEQRKEPDPPESLHV